MNQFKETYNLFKSAIVDLNSDTYWKWMLIPNDLKAAALYVQFYDAITLAWSKTQKPFIEEETAVSTVIQYIIKNVEVIKEDRKRFTPNYLYKVAFNALYPLGRIQRDELAWSNRRSMYTLESEDDLLDSDNIYYNESNYSDVFFDTTDPFVDTEQEEIWEIIDACDDATKKVIESLIGGRKLGKKLNNKAPEIIEMLRLKLHKFF